MDLLVVMPTGSGKTAIMFVFAMAIRRLPPGFKGYPSTVSKSLVVVGMPLAMLILDQHSNPFKVRGFTHLRLFEFVQISEVFQFYITDFCQTSESFGKSVILK